MDRVVCILELLELILLHLDMGTLLVSALRVSKMWNALINTSIALQRALYFQPALPSSQSDTTSQPVVNPLLKQRFGNCFFDNGVTYGYRANMFYMIPCAGLVPWPSWPGIHRNASKVEDLMPLDLHEDEIICRKLTRKEASWRKMLVSQPPPLHLGYLKIEEGSVWYDSVQRKLLQPHIDLNSPGLRMGTLYDIVQYHLGHHDVESTWFHVIWNEARKPYATRPDTDWYNQLLQSTNVMVEFYHMNHFAFEHCELPDRLKFDKCFRSEGYRDIDIGTDKDIGDPIDYYDRGLAV
ncbi:F-box domain-containing protein [Astrocystis sublimbata]|nr:F-box domain-containing protein [Astrocystis sublimbata]